MQPFVIIDAIPTPRRWARIGDRAALAFERALQQQMEREPRKHWRIYPKDLEASVSA